MRNLFTALKQDTHANHAVLEKTFPFSMYHENGQFNVEAYATILHIMQVFHETTTKAVKKGISNVPELSKIGSMINSEAVLSAISHDTHAIKTLSQSSTHSVNIDSPRFNQNQVFTAATSMDKQPNEQLLPAFNSATSQTIAAIYVWLGSSMGANIIARRLNTMEAGIPTQYYQAMASCAKTWVSFKQDVDALLPTLGLAEEWFVEETVADANAWFEFLISMGIQAERSSALYSQEALNAC